MAQVDTSKQWTTSGWKPKESPHARAYFVDRTVAQGNQRKQWFSKYVGGFAHTPKTEAAHQITRKAGETRGKQAYKASRDRLWENYRNKTRFGKEASKKVMKEYEKRMEGMFGSLLIGGAK